jgi:xanthosine utilization system XapX-like protein
MLVGVALCWLSLPLPCNAALLALVGVAYGYQFARVRGWVLMLALCKLHCKVPPIQLRGVV